MNKRLETAVAGSLLMLGIGFIAFMEALVAKPKMLFGRSLSAIEPTLFPLIAMGMMIVFCGVYFLQVYRESKDPSADMSESAAEDTDWLRVGAFFMVLFFYAMTFDWLGFMTSTFLSMVALSLLAGNRHYLQIIAFSFALPLAFYLVATRLLLVSLPEQGGIELLIARILGELSR